MDRYKKTFKQLKKKKEKALVAFTVIGDPTPSQSLEVMKAMVLGGADILELGLPFSDPIADGPTIQAADNRALRHITTNKVFQIIKKIRKETDIPIGLLVYYNLVYQRGINKFYKDANAAGVDSILVADVPIEESNDIVKAARKNKINPVFLISPVSGPQRIKKIAKRSKGFVYAIARLGVTGTRKDVQDQTLKLVKRIKRSTKIPVCVGFGVSQPKHVKTIANARADGIIVGSAIVKHIEKHLKNKNKMLHNVETFVRSLKNATKNN